MQKLTVIFNIICLNAIYYNGAYGINKNIEKYQNEVEDWLDKVDQDLSKFNSLSALLTWKLSTVPDKVASHQAIELGIVRNKWKNKICSSNTIKKNWLKPDQKRKLYLLCRGPRFNDKFSRSYMQIMSKLAQEYNSEICFSENNTSTLYALNKGSYNIDEIIYPGKCVYGEPDLERLMKRSDLSEEQLKWIWTTWHNYVGPKIKDYFPTAISIQNWAAQSNGYSDMGEVWREELEIKNLEEEVMNLYEEIKPLYVLLHAVSRYKLLEKYGASKLDAKGPIPIHLLGNMWGQDWSALLPLFLPKNETIDFQRTLVKKNWTVRDMVLRAEDMYTSLDLPQMTPKFWKYSIFEENENTSVCHGSAANLFNKNDFRMMLCAKVTMEDFYVIHHEMGHIEYYMAYKDQPQIFQDGANSAFHESIGDAVMHGVMVPQHLHRLSLITDNNLLDKNLDTFLLLQQALTKIPEIAFALVIDKYRWDVFNGKIKPTEYNKIYWKLTKIIRGVNPPEERGEEYFDIGGKYHISDNTPYIRYFLSNILQMQIFKSMCDLSLYGKTINLTSHSISLNRCDIYGSRKAGKRLQEMMRLGSSQHWSKTLKLLTGNDYITAKPLLDYYKPIYIWLENYVKRYNVNVGW